MYTGIDLVKVERWERLLTKFPERGGKIFKVGRAGAPSGRDFCEARGGAWRDGDGGVHFPRGGHGRGGGGDAGRQTS